MRSPYYLRVWNRLILVSYIRLWRVLFHFVELTGCIAPAGMESGAISDFQISASSQKTDSFAASRARLNVKVTGLKQGGWSPLKDDLNQWLQVDLSGYTTVTRLATQGRDGSDEWVTKYKLQYSVDGVIYHFYKGRGESSSTVRKSDQFRFWETDHLPLP